MTRANLILARFAVWMAMSVVFVACNKGQNADTPEPATPQPQTLAVLREEVRRMVGEPLCQNVAECRAAPFGAKPCGGPRSFVVYSTRNTDPEALTAAIAHFDSLDAERNRQMGLTSDCSVVMPPDLICEVGICAVSSAVQRTNALESPVRQEELP